jgi:hypothetical protein
MLDGANERPGLTRRWHVCPAVCIHKKNRTSAPSMLRKMCVPLEIRDMITCQTVESFVKSPQKLVVSSRELSPEVKGRACNDESAHYFLYTTLFLGILETLSAPGHVSDPRGGLRGPQRPQAPPPSPPA